MTSAPTPGLQLMGAVCWHGPAGERIAFECERRFQLLALLACHDAPVPRSQLAEWLWPGHEPGDARRNLRKVLLQAHHLCAALPQAPPLELQGEQLRWHAATDLRAFLDAWRSQDHARAVRAYRPGLLAGLDTNLGDEALEWLARQRAWLDGRWHAAAWHWLDGLQHAPRAQAEAAEEILACDPLDEATLRALLRVCAVLGEPARGLRALQAYTGRLQQELAIAPSPELAVLGQALHITPAPMVTPRLRSVPARAVQGIVEAAMDAVAEPASWPMLLQRLTQAAHGLGSMFVGCSVVRAQDGFLLTYGLDRGLGQLFMERYQDNPRTRTMATVPPGRAINATVAAGPALERTPLNHEILRPQGIAHDASVRLPMDEPFICGGVSIEFGGAHARERAAQATLLLEHLAPYLQRAAAALLRARNLPHAETLAASLDLLPCAVLILAASRQVLFANAPAQALLEAADALRLVGNRLAAAQPMDAPRLDALLADATGQACRRAQLRLPRQAGRPALMLSIIPMRASQDRPSLPEGAATLVLAEEGTGQPSERAFLLGQLAPRGTSK